jgi:hypothetical protein
MRLRKVETGRLSICAAPRRPRLRRLLASGRLDAAVGLYFASVGGRWDEERLVVETVDVRQSPGATALPDAARHMDAAGKLARS